MASTIEAECAGLFINAQDAVPLIITLLGLFYPKMAILTKTDNNIA